MSSHRPRNGALIAVVACPWAIQDSRSHIFVLSQLQSIQSQNGSYIWLFKRGDKSLIWICFRGLIFMRFQKMLQRCSRADMMDVMECIAE